MHHPFWKLFVSHFLPVHMRMDAYLPFGSVPVNFFPLHIDNTLFHFPQGKVLKFQWLRHRLHSKEHSIHVHDSDLISGLPNAIAKQQKAVPIWISGQP